MFRRPAIYGTVVALLTTVVLGVGVSSTERVGSSRLKSRAPRILVLYDLEGASGVLNGRAISPETTREYALGRESLISDVSIVVDALFEGGAASVDVQNTHGDLDPELVPRSRLDSRVRVLPRQATTIYHPDGVRDFGDRYDAVVAVAMHTKPLAGGISPHTVGAGLSPYINGKTLTETELIALSAGTVDLPVILVSGDDYLQRDLAQAMPWIEYAVVKKWIVADSVAAIPAEDVRSVLRARSLSALRGLPRMRTMRLDAPIKAGLLATFPHDLPPGLKNGSLPGLKATGDTVWFESPDYRSAWTGIRVLMTIAQGRNAQRSLAFLQQRPDAQAAMAALRDSTNAQWLRVEARAMTGR